MNEHEVKVAESLSVLDRSVLFLDSHRVGKATGVELVSLVGGLSLGIPAYVKAMNAAFPDSHEYDRVSAQIEQLQDTQKALADMIPLLYETGLEQTAEEVGEVYVSYTLQIEAKKDELPPNHNNAVETAASFIGSILIFGLIVQGIKYTIERRAKKLKLEKVVSGS